MVGVWLMSHTCTERDNPIDIDRGSDRDVLV